MGTRDRGTGVRVPYLYGVQFMHLVAKRSQRDNLELSKRYEVTMVHGASRVSTSIGNTSDFFTVTTILFWEQLNYYELTYIGTSTSS